jgi:hypothetical protein
MKFQRRRRSAPPKVPPGGKTAPPSFLTRVNQFLERTQKLPLWVLAGTLAAASVPFAWSFFNSYPEQRAYFEQQSVRFDRALAAGDDVLHIMDQLTTALASARAVVRNYQETFGGKSVGDALDRPSLEQGAALSHTAQSRFAVAAAAIASADFPDAALNAATTAMRGDIQAQQKKMKNFNALYAAALRPDPPAISAAIKQIRTDNDDTDAVKEALLDRWQHFSQEADRFHAEAEIEVERASRQIWLFYLHEALAWVAALYVIGFAIIGFRAFRRSH